MSDESVRTKTFPAAVPFLIFAISLAAVPHLDDSTLAIRSLCTAGLLTLGLPRIHGRARLALLALIAAAGIESGSRDAWQIERLQHIAEQHSDRFVTLRVPIGEPWRIRQDGSALLRARSFSIEPEHDHFRRPLTIIIYGDPPSIDGASTLEAEGFLRVTDRQQITLAVKTARLIRPEGRASRFDPAYWSRLLSTKFDRLSESDTSLEGAVGLVRALALGQNDRLAENLRTSFRLAGTYHLLVFSGMQIALVAGLISRFLRSSRWPFLSDVALLMLSLGAPRFAGGDPSISRCSWMIGLYALSRLARRPTQLENLLFVAAITRLAAYPMELRDAGFCLSFGATAGLLLIGKPLARQVGERLHALRPLAWGVGAELAVAPLTVFYFRQWPVAGSVLTLVLAPVVGAMFLISVAACLTISMSPIIAETLTRVVGTLGSGCVAANGLASGGLRLVALLAAPPALVVATAFGLLVVGRAATDRRGLRMFAPLALMAPILWSSVVTTHRATVPTPQIEALDVGQGDSILLRSGDKVVLMDGGGGRFRDSFGRSVLLPMLIDRGVRRVDIMILSHPHPDHSGGLRAVMETLDVDLFAISARHVVEQDAIELLEVANKRRINVTTAERRRKLQAGDMSFDLFPANLRFKRSPLNNGSLVVLTKIGRLRALLTGDIERERERDLLTDGVDLHADILKVAHHGARNSSTRDFLDAVSPRIALVSCGRANRFGHPAHETMNRIRERTVLILRTDREGSVIIHLATPHLFASREFDRPR